MVTWTSSGQDGSYSGVYGQKYSCVERVCDEEMVVDFGGTYGLWHYDQGSLWTLLNTLSPGLMIAADIDNDGQDELVVALPGFGLYTYDQTNGWTQINSDIPEAVIPFRNGIACDFGASFGIWVWNQTGGWKRINFADVEKMIAADIDGDGQDELIVSFVGWGLYIYNEARGWTKINNVIPNAMIGLKLKN